MKSAENYYTDRNRKINVIFIGRVGVSVAHRVMLCYYDYYFRIPNTNITTILLCRPTFTSVACRHWYNVIILSYNILQLGIYDIARFGFSHPNACRISLLYSWLIYAYITYMHSIYYIEFRYTYLMELLSFPRAWTSLLPSAVLLPYTHISVRNIGK